MESNLIKATFTANGTIIIPAGHAISGLFISETANAAITGGLRIGTTNGGVDVIVALSVAGLQIQHVLDTVLLKRLFSMTNDTTLYVQAVTLWNSANTTLHVSLHRLIP